MLQVRRVDVGGTLMLHEGLMLQDGLTSPEGWILPEVLRLWDGCGGGKG